MTENSIKLLNLERKHVTLFKKDGRRFSGIVTQETPQFLWLLDDRRPNKEVVFNIDDLSQIEFSEDNNDQRRSN